MIYYSLPLMSILIFTIACNKIHFAHIVWDCSILQRVTVCCSLLQCAATEFWFVYIVFLRAYQSSTVHFNFFQCVAVCCNVLQGVVVWFCAWRLNSDLFISYLCVCIRVHRFISVCFSVLQCITVCFSVLVCCSLLLCVATQFWFVHIVFVCVYQSS